MLDQNDIDNNFAMHNGFGGAMDEDNEDEDQLDAAMPAVDYPVVDLADVVAGNNSSNIAYFDVSCILSADRAPAPIGEASMLASSHSYNVLDLIRSPATFGAASMLASSHSYNVLDLIHNRLGHGNKKMLIEVVKNRLVAGPAERQTFTEAQSDRPACM